VIPSPADFTAEGAAVKKPNMAKQHFMRHYGLQSSADALITENYRKLQKLTENLQKITLEQR